MNNYFAGNTLYGKTGLSVYKLNQNSIDQSYSYGETLTWNDSTTVKRDILYCDNDGLQSFDPQELVVTYSMVVTYPMVITYPIAVTYPMVITYPMVVSYPMVATCLCNLPNGLTCAMAISVLEVYNLKRFLAVILPNGAA